MASEPHYTKLKLKKLVHRLDFDSETWPIQARVEVVDAGPTTQRLDIVIEGRDRHRQVISFYFCATGLIVAPILPRQRGTALATTLLQHYRTGPVQDYNAAAALVRDVITRALPHLPNTGTGHGR